jgi:monooxygenase
MSAVEHLDVLVVGAGLSGIGAGAYLQDKCPWASYALFEARDAIGGTWDLFRYPGIRSDSDMFTLGYSFRPWDGEKSIADGPSILRYIEDTARETGVDKHIRFNHKIESADWSSDDALWRVTARRTDTNETFELTAGFIFSCTGYYRYDEGYTPEFPGRDAFAGTIVHPQHWPEDLDYAGKKIVVIGSGATAVTLIPSLADKAAHVTMLQRSPTYIVSMPESDALANALRRFLPARVSGPMIRWFKALMTQASYFLSKRRPEFVKSALKRQVVRQLPAGYDVDTHFTPRYNPWDQRLCLVPNGDLFKAISAGTASVVTDTIKTFDATGIALDSGAHLDADIIVTATGLDLLFLGGIALSVDGEAVHPHDKLTYKGMMLDGVPNLAFAIGYTNASWTLKCDLTCDYVTRLLNHMHHEGLRQALADASRAEESDASVFGLNSGYINRAADRLPRQGAAFPWQVKQSYLADYRAMKLKSIEDDEMVFV